MDLLEITNTQSCCREFEEETGVDESKNSTGTAPVVFLTPELVVRFDDWNNSNGANANPVRTAAICVPDAIGLVVLSVWQLH